MKYFSIIILLKINNYYNNNKLTYIFLLNKFSQSDLAAQYLTLMINFF